jgi:hypothetical protein
VHECKHPEVQFVLAVRAFPLVNNLVSLWIFLGTLEPKANTGGGGGGGGGGYSYARESRYDDSD